MPSILVVYYSRSGTTRQVAKQLAEKLGADLLAVQDIQSRRGLSGYLRSALEVMGRSLPAIEPTCTPLSRYDLIVLGTPVWMGRLSSPMRRFLNDHAPQMRKAAFFTTMGGKDARRAFADMQELLNHPPVATLALTHGQVLHDQCLAPIHDFASELERAAMRPAAPHIATCGEPQSACPSLKWQS
ncbi:Flavodoxin [Dyella sp. OK004]|uniref:flavodoxin family protein n=1 Tax=Dyella sp. OK004 TaxID=1855292 RepID=UPI0008E12C85|nr:flavodoxin [Dyella sp. OK004]SFS13943.1 Flavodoxin [Dyella sp. OK004]